MIKKEESKYNIWVDNILYNSFTDKAIAFEDNEIEDIHFYLKHLKKFETDYSKIFDDFVKLGFVKNATFNELDHILFQNKKITLCNKNYHLTINPTLQCNYKCWYCCVEDQNTFYEKRGMDEATVEKIKKHIKYMVEEEHIAELYLDWFGGEPLMYFKDIVYPLSIYAFELCKSNNIPFRSHVTTNAYFIDLEMINAFNEIHLNNFQIPIDGDEKKHNAVKNHNGEGHYSRILKTINDICENMIDAKIIMRINYDKQTLRTVSAVINDIKKENRQKIFIDFQRVWQVDLNRDSNGDNLLLIKIKQKFERAGFRTMYFAYRKKDYRSCYADSFYHRVINYDGKVFKCSARDYNDDLCIATIKEDGSMDFSSNIISRMFAEPTFNNTKCLNCKRLPLCYGPCIQRYYEAKIGKSTFKCVDDFSEISFIKYVNDKVNRNLEYIMP
jgi:uncharacterized protein